VGIAHEDIKMVEENDILLVTAVKRTTDRNGNNFYLCNVSCLFLMNNDWDVIDMTHSVSETLNRRMTKNYYIRIRETAIYDELRKLKQEYKCDVLFNSLLSSYKF
jgi:hypothetical protein